MFNNEEEDDNVLSEFEKWYDENLMYLKRESNEQSGPTLDISLFYTGIYNPVMQELAPLVRKLMLRQYPVIDTEYRHMVLDYINWLVSSAGHRLLLNLFVLVRDQKEGINLREKYPDFENWIEVYARPSKPQLVSVEDFSKFTVFTNHEKKSLVAEENIDIITIFEKKEKLKKDYYDIVQPIVFKHYPALQDLDYDGWIIYAVHIREDYEDFKYRCEHVKTFIEYEFQEEDINLKYDEFQAKFRLKYNERWENKHH